MFNPSARPDRKRNGGIDFTNASMQTSPNHYGAFTFPSNDGERNHKKRMQNFGFPAATGREHVGIVPPIQYTPAQLAFMEAERSRQVAPVDPDTIARQAQKDISAAKMDVKLFNNRAQDTDWEWRMANLSEDQLDREIELCKTYKNDAAVLGFDARASRATSASSSSKRGMDVDD